MTNREFYEAVINANVSEAVTDKATYLLEQLKTANSAKALAKAEENAPIIEAISNYLSGREEATMACEIAKAVGVSTSKAVALAKKLEGVRIVELKVNGRKVNGYLLER